MGNDKGPLLGGRELVVVGGVLLLGSCHLIAGYDDFEVPEEPSATTGQGGMTSQGGGSTVGTGGTGGASTSSGSGGDGGSGGAATALLPAYVCEWNDTSFKKLADNKDGYSWESRLHVIDGGQNAIDVFVLNAATDEQIREVARMSYVYSPASQPMSAVLDYNDIHQVDRFGSVSGLLVSKRIDLPPPGTGGGGGGGAGPEPPDTAHELSLMLRTMNSLENQHLATIEMPKGEYNFDALFAPIQGSGATPIGDLALVVATENTDLGNDIGFAIYDDDSTILTSTEKLFGTTGTNPENFGSPRALLRGKGDVTYLFDGQAKGDEKVQRFAIPDDYTNTGIAPVAGSTHDATSLGGFLAFIHPTSTPGTYLPIGFRANASSIVIAIDHIDETEVIDFTVDDLTRAETLPSVADGISESHTDSTVVLSAPAEKDCKHGVWLTIASLTHKFTQHEILELPASLNDNGPVTSVGILPEVSIEGLPITLHVAFTQTDAGGYSCGSGGAGGGAGGGAEGGAGGGGSFSQRMYYGQMTCIAPTQ